MAVELPEWAQYVAAAVGVTMAAVAAKMGWGSAPKPGSVEVAGALIDKQAAHAIVESLSQTIAKYVDIQEEIMELNRDLLQSNRDYNRELMELRSEIRELSRTIYRGRST